MLQGFVDLPGADLFLINSFYSLRITTPSALFFGSSLYDELIHPLLCGVSPGVRNLGIQIGKDLSKVNSIGDTTL